MTEEKEKILSDMTRAEKAELLQWIVRDLGDAFPGIESRPGIVGGDYPTLTGQDLANAWAYVRSHRTEIEEAIETNERDDH